MIAAQSAIWRIEEYASAGIAWRRVEEEVRSPKPILAEEISENPCCSGNREGLDGFAPSGMTVGIRDNQRYPHEQHKDQEHHCQQAGGEKCHSIGKKSHGRECEQNSRRYRPKHLTWRKPLRNKMGGSAKINRLFESKGSGTDAQKDAADPIKRFR